MSRFNDLFLCHFGKCLAGFALVSTLCASSGLAQAHVEGLGLYLGIAAGTPITKIDSGASGKPGAGMLRGMHCEIGFGQHWGLDIGFQFARLKSEFSTPVGGDTLIMQEILPGVIVPIETFYSGQVSGHFDDRYYQLPILVQYRWKAWQVEAGGYAGLMAGADVSGAADIVVGDSFRVDLGVPFDHSAHLNQLDLGFVVGVARRGANGLELGFRVAAGLNSIYQKEFTQIPNPVRNLYAQIYIGYFLANKD